VYLDYVRDMLESAEKAIEFVRGMGYDEFAGSHPFECWWSL